MLEGRYADKKAAEAADAIGEGRWIPDIPPNDAADIREVHNIDTNLTWGCFKTQDITSVRTALRGMKAKLVQGPVGQGPSELFRNFSWWPASMRSATIEAWDFNEPPLAPALSGFSVRAGIDVKTGVVCFHRTI